MNEIHDPTEETIVAFFDGTLDASRQRQLAQLLEDSQSARELFDSYMRLEGMAVELGQANCLTTPLETCSQESGLTPNTASDEHRSRLHPSGGVTPNFRRWTARAVMAATAVTLGVVIAAFSWWSRPPATLATPVGQISRIVAADWISGARAIGGDIVPGTYELRGGLVELEFDNGATVILEGPAHFEVASGEQTYLRHGRVRTLVPPEAYGFMIETPAMKVVDLGTEFGLEVDASGSGEIHVFDGEVEIYNRPDRQAGDRMLLAAGEALRVDLAGQFSDIPADIDAFVDRLTLESRASAYVEEMTDQLERIDVRLAGLVAELKQAESAVRKSKELRRLKRTASEARKRWAKAQKDDPDVREAVQERDATRVALNRGFEDAMERDDRGRRLLLELHDANSMLAQLKDELVAAKRDPERARQLSAIHRQLREVQQSRNRVRGEIRKLRAAFRKQHPEIRKASQKLVKARKELNKQLSKPRFGKLRDKATSRHKEFLASQRQRLLNDQQVRKLKAQVSDMRQRQRFVKRNIQQARHATMTFAAFETPGELKPRDDT